MCLEFVQLGTLITPYALYNAGMVMSSPKRAAGLLHASSLPQNNLCGVTQACKIGRLCATIGKVAHIQRVRGGPLSTLSDVCVLADGVVALQVGYY